MGTLQGKVGVVSGGGTGIGAATARRFAAEGASVVVTGRRPEPLGTIAAQTGGVAVPGDVTQRGQAERVVAEARARFGGLDVVVANAGVGFGGAAGEVDDERWTRTIEINVTGVLRLVRAAIPALLERGGGSIVVVSSVSGLVGGPESAAYDASKAALLGLVRSIAIDYGPRGIRANAVCPGWVVTPMGDESMDELGAERGLAREDAYALATAHIPLRRPATAEEIAACCLFLASEESSIVTGIALVADGGGTAVDVASLAFGPDPR
ncbi:MAG TPA: SDR family oxidoreductase [Actinomycetota bacterium]|nr:SDR family oxidoreductase [Actinomycetota bacterium]